MKRICKATTRSQRGNVFFALFGAVAFVGVLGAATMSFVKGPLTSSVTLSRVTAADTHMQVTLQKAVLQIASKNSFGDCDGDGFVEPIEFKPQADVNLKPVGGGNIPDLLDATSMDPWGRLYGYCVWNSGSNITIDSVGACDDSGDGAEQRIEGSSNNYAPIISLVSAGPDRVFQTTCQSFDDADVNNNGALGDAGDGDMVDKTANSDDIILSYTYAEAHLKGGEIWSIKSSDSNTAIVDNAIELSGGLTMGTYTSVTVCGPSTANVMRFNSFDRTVEICDGATNWNPTTMDDAETFTSRNSVNCDISMIGHIRFNSANNLPEVCAGNGWRLFGLSALTPTPASLLLLSTTLSGMDVDATNNLDVVNCTGPWSCGAEETFTLQNIGETDSLAITLGLEDGTNFVITTEDCTGELLSQMETCTINVRPKANGNAIYSDRIEISTENSPFSVLSGVSSGFGCSPGFADGGGYIAACDVNDGDGLYDLVVSPSGCDGTTTNPTCIGSDTAALLKTWGPNSGTFQHLCYNTSSTCPPAQQHEAIMQYRSFIGEPFPAAEYCDNLDVNGYTDWYLPSTNQLRLTIMPLADNGTLPGFANNYYVTSHLHDSDEYDVVHRNGTVNDYDRDATALYVRCVRRHNIPMPGSLITDTNPNDVSFTTATSFTSGTTMTSNTVTITEIMQDINVSLTGTDGSPAIIHNGVDVGTTVSGVTWGDTIAIEMNAPSVLGTSYDVDIAIGDDSETFRVFYVDSSRTARVFATSSTYRGDLGGVGGANAKCVSEAATSSLGLPSGWKAIIATGSVSAYENIPVNWGTLEDVNGTAIVDGGVGDLFDGNLDNAISLDESGNVVAGTVWSGSYSNGGEISDSVSCGAWTSAGSSNTNDLYGTVGQSGSGWLHSEDYNCSQYRRLYCVEDIDDTSDTTPDMFYPEYNIQVATSTRQNSNSITIDGMSGGSSPTMNVSATGGTPTFTINGGAEVTSGAVSNGDVVVFYMTSPATDNSYERMSITVDSLTTYWRVWTGDSTGSAVKRVFVTSSNYNGTFGGLAGADSTCQSAAASAGMGGSSWKAILSGILEAEWAVNRVGYNWSTLELVDGTDVVLAPNLWKTNTTPWLSSISKDQSGTDRINENVHSNITVSGRARSSTPNSTYNCYNWTSTSGGSHTVYRGNTSGTTWPSNLGGSYWVNGCSARLFCVEQ